MNKNNVNIAFKFASKNKGEVVMRAEQFRTGYTRKTEVEVPKKQGFKAKSITMAASVLLTLCFGVAVIGDRIADNSAITSATWSEMATTYEVDTVSELVAHYSNLPKGIDAERVWDAIQYDPRNKAHWVRGEFVLQAGKPVYVPVFK